MRESVPAALTGERFDRVVALLTGLARSRVAELVDAGQATLDGSVVARSARVEEGQWVEVEAEQLVPPKVDADDPGPEPDVEFGVVHEDADVIVIDKPAGLVVHPGSGNLTGTLVNGLVARWPEIAAVGDRRRPGIVHRLDKGTSGLMVVARSARGFESLSLQLRRRAVSRRYLALVWGIVEGEKGVIDAPIGRSERSPLRQTVSASGREARTAYEVLERWPEPGVTLLECTLETGRMHQIRVHLTAIGHAVVGDAGYRGDRQGFGENLGRPFLHAWRLAFEHPDGGGLTSFESRLPTDLAELLPGGVGLPSG
jgi:23S rRNA pseudouridine1911/1915/1917 synthase